MALSDIIQKINDETNKKAAFMKQVADDEIKKIDAESAEKAVKRTKEIEDATSKKQSSVVEKAKILAKMASKSSLLKEKREVIDVVYTEVEKELNTLNGSEYVQLIVSMLKKATTSMPKGNLTVPSARKKETEEAISKAGVEYHIHDETNDFKGGFIVYTSKAEVNFSFPYLLQKIVRPTTELEVAKVIFE